ncbi:hypothetical protein [Bradyrhizobium sp. URHC0002]
MIPFRNSVEIQAQVPAITAMTIKENAIDPRSSPTFSLPRHVSYLVGEAALPALLFFFLAFRASKISHRHFNQKVQTKK